ncbi:MAG: ABC transporter permease [Gammaproteobacteria bacterium]|nr:ABC transporter permease [Gammaproteobacteria bacterium]MYF38554.1 ABC transporter permease [Gammaproteobacteria bacterium]
MKQGLFSQFTLIFQLGVRNLWRQRRRNTILLVSVICAITGVVVLNSLIRGMQAQMVDQVVYNLNGHITLHAPDYRSDPAITRGFIEDSEAFTRKLESVKLAGWASRIKIPAVVMSERETRGVQIVALDPAQEHISIVADLPVEGTFLASSEDNRIVLGRALLTQLRTKIGHRIVVVMQDIDSKSIEVGFQIAGVYDSDSEGMEKHVVFVGKHTLQQFLGSESITELSLRFNTRLIPPDGLEAISKAFPNLEVVDWKNIDPILAFMYESVNAMVYIWLAIVFTALVFGLMNTFITAVLERTQEIGLCKSMGMKSSLVLYQVVTESLIIMLLGLIGGLLLSWGVLQLLGDGIDLSAFAAGVEMLNLAPKIRPAVVWQDINIVIVATIFLALVASLYPAIRAVRLDPLVALKD